MSGSLLDRVGSAPISWGICEVPGWGAQLPVDRVLAEMVSLDLTATELGSIGYLPTDPDELKQAALDTTIFVKNGPCMAGLGLGGEGYLSYSVATPTGEG